MKYVLAANYEMYRLFLENFANYNKDCYKYIGECEDDSKGLDKNSLIILYENYKDNPFWILRRGFRCRINGFTNIFEIKQLDWVL